MWQSSARNGHTRFSVDCLLVFGTGMFFAIKWHYEQGKKGKEKQSAVLRTSGKVAAVFVLSLLGLSLLAFGLGRMLDLDLGFP
ncbi:hypothetical protein ACGLHS_09885 [Variovorax sp. VaC1]|uniref:hypothetical protein n=1 Tax=Variovorax sp. VaC1 TaxID=3373132 RepID=UPI003749EEDB